MIISPSSNSRARLRPRLTEVQSLRVDRSGFELALVPCLPWVNSRNYNLFTQSVQRSPGCIISGTCFLIAPRQWQRFQRCQSCLHGACMSFNLKLSKPSRINCLQLFPELLLRAVWVGRVWGGETGDAILHRKMIRKLNPLPPRHSTQSSACGCHNKYAKSLPAAGVPHTQAHTHTRTVACGP